LRVRDRSGGVGGMERGGISQGWERGIKRDI